MGLVTRMMASYDRPTTLPGPLDDYWYKPLGQAAMSGVRVTPDTAQAVSTVYACVAAIAEPMASLPLIVYQRTASGGKRRAAEHPLYGLLATRPNRWQTAFEWREMMFGHVLLRGNAFSHILPGPRGPVDQLVPIHPDRVTVERASDQTLRYWVLQKDGMTKIPFLQSEIFHLRGKSSDGVTGDSVVGLMREAIGLALATESYGARLFSQNASPRGVLQHPKTLTPEQIERLRATWTNSYSGLPNAHSTAVLEEGMTWQQIGMNNDDSQFLATRQHQAEEIARFFRMQPHKVGILERMTFNNIEHLAIEYVTDTLRPWAVRFEQCVARDLILAPQTYYVEFLFDALLRGDTLSRFQAYATAAGGGAPWMSRNEIRAMENREPLDGLDEVLEPMNMTAAGAATVTKGAQNPGPDQNQQQARLLALQAAGRMVRKEIVAVRRAAVRLAADDERWRAWLGEFYAKHAEELQTTLGLAADLAAKYAERTVTELTTGAGAIETWEPERSEDLAAMILGGEAR